RGESVWLGFFPVRGIAPVRAARASARRCEVRRALPTRTRATRTQPRATRLGRRLVASRVLRRWDAARFGAERGVSDRFNRAELVGAVGRRLARARASGDGSPGRASRAARRRAREAAR